MSITDFSTKTSEIDSVRYIENDVMQWCFVYQIKLSMQKYIYRCAYNIGSLAIQNFWCNNLFLSWPLEFVIFDVDCHDIIMKLVRQNHMVWTVTITSLSQWSNKCCNVHINDHIVEIFSMSFIYTWFNVNFVWVFFRLGKTCDLCRLQSVLNGITEQNPALGYHLLMV